MTSDQIGIHTIVVRICDHWFTLTDPPRFHLSLHPSIVRVHGPSRLHFEPPKLPNFDFNADPDHLFTLNADPDPAF
jgi:hypothetical protein